MVGIMRRWCWKSK